MIEKCCIHDIGFLTIKLSTQWMAQKIQKMLTDGIDSWAPIFNMPRATIDFASRNIAEEMDVGNLRSTLIGDTIARMLEFFKVHVYRRNHVWEHLGDQATQFGMLIQHLVERYPNSQVKDLPIGELEVLYKDPKKLFIADVEFKERAQKVAVMLGRPSIKDIRYPDAYRHIREVIQKGYEKVYKRLGIHVKEEVKIFGDVYISVMLDTLREQDLIKDQEIFIEGKTKSLTLVREDGTFDYASTDLANLRYQLIDRSSQWIVYVTDIGKREYYEMFFTELVVFELKWLRYAFLKKSRMFNYVFNFDEILNDEGNTAVYLLNAYAEISSFTKSEDIKELKNAGEFKLVNNEEHELGLHLLRFTEVVKMACLSVLPNILGKYLFDLSQKFRVVYVGYISRLNNVEKLQKMIDVPIPDWTYSTRSKKMVMNRITTIGPEIVFDERTNMLLLSKATKVVMKKCFDLLGITPVDEV